MPPNGSVELRFIRRNASTESKRLAFTIEISSITNTSALVAGDFSFFRISDSRIHVGGKLHNEWIVWPPTVIAAIPVGATTSADPSKVDLIHRMNVLLPVPAPPETKTIRLPELSRSWTFEYSGRTSTPASEPSASDAARRRLEPALFLTEVATWPNVAARRDRPPIFHFDIAPALALHLRVPGQIGLDIRIL